MGWRISEVKVKYVSGCILKEREECWVATFTQVSTHQGGTLEEHYLF